MATANVDTSAIKANVETSETLDNTLLATVAVTVSYVTLELVNHVVLATYVSPWLVSVGLSTATATTISYAVLFLVIIGIGWVFSRYYKRKQKNE